MIIVGHRGARNEAPENTSASFEHAFQQGCRHFELDIQLSKDKQLVVFHDTSLKRTTGKRGKVRDYTAAELTLMDARNNTPGWPQACPIPLLEDVVSRLPRVEHWQFEVKSDNRFRLGLIARQLIHFVQQRKLYGSVTLTSSNRWFLAAARAMCTRISLGLVAESRLYDSVKAATLLQCEYLCLWDKLATPKRIEAANQAGLKVSVWTVNQEVRMRELAGMGAFSVITDVPSKAMKLLGHSAQEPSK